VIDSHERVNILFHMLSKEIFVWHEWLIFELVDIGIGFLKTGSSHLLSSEELVEIIG
jgi:hypothetical protein